MATGVSSSSQVRVVALGGFGEIGLNLLAIECGEDTLIIDAGVMFPEERWLGTDLLIPELAHLARGRRRFLGVILTHAHEDHIGALPFLLRRFAMPVYGSELTLAFARRRVQDRGGGLSASFNKIEPRLPFKLGPFQIEALRVTHSTPDSVALAIDTPAGLIIHSGDFKIDETPVDRVAFDRKRFAELGERGVSLLLSDSTNVEREGRSASESSLKPVLREVITRTRGKFFLSSFSSHIHRIRQVAEVSHEVGRRVVPLGRSMVQSTRIGIDLGHLSFPVGTFVDRNAADTIDRERLTFLASGSQGEPLSALVKIAADSHPRVRLEPGDTVVLSSRFIPGNERTINRLINQLYKRGAEVYYDAVAPVHVTGHACRDELSELIRLTRPKYFVPIHGEYRHLARHVSLAIESGVPENNCYLLENGEPLVIDETGARRAAEVETGRVAVTEAGLGGLEVLRERQALAREGTVVAVVAVSRQSGEIIAGPNLISRGFTSGDGTSPVMREARAAAASDLARLGTGTDEVEGELKRSLEQFFSAEVGRCPAVVPCVIKV
jgi:ribonuclease J